MTEPDNQAQEAPEAGDPAGGTPEDEFEGTPEDGTLRGYFSVHERPPAFEGSDGRPYTVSVEVEQVGDLTNPFAAYLVFPRWTHDGSSVEGHVQTPLLARGRSRGAVEKEIGDLSLERTKELLEEALHRSWGETPGAGADDPGGAGPRGIVSGGPP